MPKSRESELRQLLASTDQYIADLQARLLEKLSAEDLHETVERLSHLKVARHNLVAAIAAESQEK